MKINPVFLLFILFVLCVQCEKHSQLSKKQKAQDFEYLYQTLEDNYPFFDAAKRNFNVDWLSNKEEYLERIKATSNDSAYFMTLISIVDELRCPHLSIVPTLSHELYLETYERATIEKPKYAKWVEVLEQSKKQSPRWQNFLRNTTEYTEDGSRTTFYSDSLLFDDKIAMMRIQSFHYDNLANDSLLITSFLKKIQDYNYLIFEIQNNDGGSSNYWKKYIVGKISDTEIIFPRNQIAKDGSLNRHFYPDFFEDGDIATKQNTFSKNSPDELFNGSFYLKSYTDTIMPNNPIPFKGKIFVLVNNLVVSASDDFTYFCKASQWATVAGIRTMGEGASSAEPTLFRLPNSGIIFNHPSVSGLNEDGSLNFETRTFPDIEINANNSDERLEKLIQYIKDNE